MIVAYIVHCEDVIVDYVDSDAGGPTAPALAMRYLHGPGPDMVLAQEDVSGGDTVLWLLTDHLGTMRDIVDHTGAAVDHIAYDSFGHVISQTAPSLLTRYLYTGRELDPETGLMYYRARFYDPTLGKFIQRDPIGFADGTNWYEYVGSSPVNWIDISGLRKGKLGPTPTVPIPDIGEGLPISPESARNSMVDIDPLSEEIIGDFVGRHHVKRLWQALIEANNCPAYDLVVRRNITNNIFQQAIGKDGVVIFLGHGNMPKGAGNNFGLNTVDQNIAPPIDFNKRSPKNSCTILSCFGQDIASAIGGDSIGQPGSKGKIVSQTSMLAQLESKLKGYANEKRKQNTPKKKIFVLIGPR